MSNGNVTVADLVKRTKVVLPAGTGYFLPDHWTVTGTLQADTVVEARAFPATHPDNYLRMVVFKCEALGRAICLLIGRDEELELA